MSSGTQNGHSPQDVREVEWQLAASDLGSVRRWLTDHEHAAGLVLAPQTALQIVDTYFDTDDWRFHRAGYALRVRSEDGRTEATLKSLHSASDEIADRRELTEPLQDNACESIRLSKGPVGSRVDAVSGAQQLQPLFEVHTSRERYAIHARDEAQALGEIALDETTISPPHGDPRTSLRRVEVESHSGSLEPLRSLVKALRSDCALEAASETKYSQGLRSVGLAPPPAQSVDTCAVDRSMRIDAVGFAYLRRYLLAWHASEPGARLGDDPEFLHELRLAGRRLDAILSQYRPFLPIELQPIRKSLKKVLRVLGEARDFDVALGELNSFADTLSEADLEQLVPLQQHLTSERNRARTHMLSVLDARSTRRDLERLAALCDTAWPQTQPLAVTAAPELVAARFRKVRKYADRLTPHSSTEAYHEVRGRLKKLRYVLESVAVIYGKPADEMLGALRRWQDKLGRQQDADVASQRLKRLAESPPKNIPPGTLFLMGRLAEHYAGAAGKARKLHAKAYRKVRGRWKKLKTKLVAAPAPLLS